MENLSEKKEIIEGNKLIKIFNGYYEQNGELVHPSGACIAVKAYMEMLPDWNDLMETIEKIENDCFSTINITNAGCIIKCNDDVRTEFPRFGKPKRKMVWLSVVEYIKWYNLPSQKYLWPDNKTQQNEPR